MKTSPPVQLPLIPPESDWRPPIMGDLPSWEGAKRVAIDTETHDQHLKDLGIGIRRGAYSIGYSFAIEDGPAFYLPFRHEGGDNLPEEQVKGYLREQAKKFTGSIVGANLSYDLDYLSEDGIEFPQIKFFRDIQVADPLIYELHYSYSLQNIAERYKLAGKDEGKLREAAKAYGVCPKSGMWRLPARYVGAYAEEDARQPLRIIRRQERLIDEKDLWDIYNLESEVLPVLVRMRRRGVRIDMDKLEQIDDWSLRQEAEALALVERETGVKIAVGDVWGSNTQFIAALEYIGLELPKTSTGKKSVSQDVFASFDHPVTKALAWARKANKLRTTFAASVRSHETNGRIHCTYHQIARESETGDQKGVRYGRLSATNPNLQQQPNPKKDSDFAGEWRKIYLPEEGAEWAVADFSQQEPRWTTHFAAEMDLQGAREAAQAYHDNPDLDNHQFMADLTGLERDFAKGIYLGLCYGEGGAKLCDDLGLPTRWALSSGQGRSRQVIYFDTKAEALKAKNGLIYGYVWRAAGEEGEDILDRFDNRAPFIRLLAKAARDRAAERGYIITGGGRRLHFVQQDDGNYDWIYKALNRVIQGTSADQTKKAIVEIDRQGYHLMLQVHDETDSSVADRGEAGRIGDIMCNVMPARVPFRVDIEIGTSWGDAK